MAAKFEIFLISPEFPVNFRKSHRISKNYLKSSESYGQKPLGSPPGLNRVNSFMDILKIIKMTLVYMSFSFLKSKIWKNLSIFLQVLV